MYDRDVRTEICSQCGEPCTANTLAIRHTKMTFITSGIVEEGDAVQVNLYFCSRMHRVQYFYSF